MAQIQRQSRLFAAEDYTAVYESYINANFQAYDFDTIREAMVNYIRDTYPESYNDWVESAEFVSLLDVIAQFGHSLAYRVDLNSRNNFLSTAERQESVYKLAEFLGYKPRRNITPFGFAKITAVRTNEQIIGNSGITLSGQDIQFENTTTADNLDNFITIMNSVFNSNNQFGSPRKQISESNIITQFYGLKNTSDQITLSFQGVAQGESTTFNVVGLNYDTEQRNYYETMPDPQSSFSIIYKNDGQGLGSNNTGFFVGLKQGDLEFQDFTIQSPVSGMSLDIDVNHINTTDVWVQTINEDGTVLKELTKVDNVYGSSAVYNTIASGNRDIYAVKSREDGQISIMFPETTFGNVPSGIIRVWYRSSLNRTYTLRPEDIQTKRISINYTGSDNNTYTAIFTIQLKENISNASSAESLADIKLNAPRIFASQDRMITADDYNNYLLSQSDDIAKIKSINRTHSGFSRYLDLNDPTGTNSNLHLFATDGTLTREELTKTIFVNNASATAAFDNYFKKYIADDELMNLYYDKFVSSFIALKSVFSAIDSSFVWQKSNTYTKTGYFIDTQSIPIITRAGKIQSNYLKYCRVGSILKFDSSGTTLFARVVSMYASGLGVDDNQGDPSGLTPDGKGAIALDAEIPDNATLELIYPPLARQFNDIERSNIITFLQAKIPFAIKYDYINTSWDIIERDPSPTAPRIIDPNNANATIPQPMPAVFDITTTIDHDNDPNTPNQDNNWLIHVTFDSTSGIDRWELNVRTVRYSLTSNQIEFSNIANEYALDEDTKKRARDVIDIIDVSNANLPTAKFFIWGYEFESNGDKSGIYNRNKVILTLEDSSDDRPSNPAAFTDIIASGDTQSNLRFEWRHVPDSNELVDPCFTNLIDVYVLTRLYDTEYRNWLRVDSSGTEPAPLTIEELNKMFSPQQNKKAMSDSIIYRPVKYKPIFGPQSDSDLQARFRIIKVKDTNFTDSEIKEKTVQAVTDYFDYSNWDFGETFYFTELAAFVHKELSGIISSFVIVPEGQNTFGHLFQITPNGDELLIPDISVTDIDIIDNITYANIRRQ